MRQVNSAIKDLSWPLPHIQDLLDKSRGCKVWTTIDLVSGYQQQRISPESEHLTAFRSPLGVFCWRTLPQGCKISPAAFSRMMQTIFGDLPFVSVYLDDLLVSSKDELEHYDHLKIVFRRMRENHLFASREKLKMFQTEVEYLGHVLTAEGIATNPKKLDVLCSWPIPKSKKEIQRLLGAFGYYRRFIQGFSKLVQPLTNLIRNDVPFKWTTECEKSFEKLKESMSSPPVLKVFDPSLETFLTTDASDVAIGAVLEQLHPDGRHPVEFLSSRLNPAQVKYPVHCKELLAIVSSLSKWRHYLQGKHVTVETDHNPLQFLKSQPKLSAMQLRWMDKINEFDLNIKYRPGRENSLADALSRREDITISNISNVFPSEQNFDTFKEGYRHDHYFATVYHALKNPSEPVEKSLVTKLERFQLGNDELLYYIYEQPIRLCVPNYQNLRETLLHDFHDTVIGGHLGYDILYSRLREIFFWPRMDKTIKHYIMSCDTCQRIKSRTSVAAGLLQPHKVPPYPFHTVAMDLIVDLPKTKRGNTNLVVFICKLSKFTYLYPLRKNASALDIAEAYFNTVFRYHGFPVKIISDRDPRFTSAFWKELQALCQTKVNLSSAFHPETDGETERRNRTVKQILRGFINVDQDNWDILLPSVEFALNSTKQSSTNCSPMMMLTGHEPLLPGSFLNAEHINSKHTNEFILKRANVIKMAKDNLIEAQNEMARLANKSRKEFSFQVGDLVMVNSANITSDLDRSRPSNKLLDLWYGPYRIMRVLSKVSYQLELPSNLKRVHDVFHISKLKRYISRSSLSNELPSPSSSHTLSDSSSQLPITILRQRSFNRGKQKIRQYLITSQEGRTNDATWINEEALDSNQQDALIRWQDQFSLGGEEC